MKGADRVIRLRMTGWQPRSVLVRIAKAPPPKRVPPSLREDFAALDRLACEVAAVEKIDKDKAQIKLEQLLQAA